TWRRSSRRSSQQMFEFSFTTETLIWPVTS
ncbi:hypothetical protein GCK32_022200, partial [Trichostrongylus colubriformis]